MSFPESSFPQEKSCNDYFSIYNQNLRKFTYEPKSQAFEIVIVKKGDFESFDLKIISGKHFLIYLECFKYLFAPKKFKLKNNFEKIFLRKNL